MYNRIAVTILSILIVWSTAYSLWMLYKVSTFTEGDYQLMPDIFHLDDFNKCLYESENGRYCFAEIQLLPNASSKLWTIIEKYSTNPLYYKHDLLRHGICVSQRCQNEKIEEECVRNIYNKIFGEFGVENKVIELKCHEKQAKYEFRNDLAMQIFLTFVVATILLALFLYKVYNVPDLVHYLTRFSSAKPSGPLSFMEGMRTIGALIVICGHEPIPPTTYMTKSAYGYVEWLTVSGLVSPSIAGPCVVQIFFVLSSFLMSLHFYRRLEKKKHIGFGEVVKVVASRFLKFTPFYALVVYWHCTSIISLSDGPYWRLILHREKEKCLKKWWHNLLYINNFDDEACLAHTWTIAIDMQFTLIGMIILWLSQNSMKKLLSWGLCFIFLEISFLFNYLWTNNYTSLPVLTPEAFYNIRFMDLEQWINMCDHTLSNIGSLGIGLFMGLLYHKNPKISTKNLNYLFYFLGCPLCFGSLAFLVIYSYTSYFKASALFFAVYGSVMKLFFPLGIAVVILPMSQGVGGSILKILNLRIFQILGEFTFAIYLIHLSIDMLYYSTYHKLNDYRLVFTNFLLVPIIFVISVFLTKFVLAPLHIIVKYLIK